MNRKISVATLLGSMGIGFLGFGLWTAFADEEVPQPVLSITQTATNEFQIRITNGVTYANYEIYRSPVLADPLNPFTLHLVGSLGQSNFTVTAGVESTGFFWAATGVDWDGDSIPNSEDGDPSNSGVGRLTLFIDAPVAGNTFD